MRSFLPLLFPAMLLAVLLLSGCPSDTLGLVRVTTVDGNRIIGVVTDGTGGGVGQMTIRSRDGSEYRLKFRNIKLIERLGDAPNLPATTGPPPPPGFEDRSRLPANVPAEVPPVP